MFKYVKIGEYGITNIVESGYDSVKDSIIILKNVEQVLIGDQYLQFLRKYPFTKYVNIYFDSNNSLEIWLIKGSLIYLKSS